jgi:hypothetical protein
MFNIFKSKYKESNDDLINQWKSFCQDLGLSLELTVISTLIFGFTLRLIAIYFGLEMPKFIYKDDDAESASSTDEH